MTCPGRQPASPRALIQCCGLVALDVTQARCRLRAHCIMHDAACSMQHPLRHTARSGSLQAQSLGATNLWTDSLHAGHEGLRMQLRTALRCVSMKSYTQPVSVCAMWWLRRAAGVQGWHE